MSDSKKIPEPPMTFVDWSDFRRGVALFNGGSYWHAHEAWEAVWIRKRELPAQRFFKGLIQLAAAHHQRTRRRQEGMLIHSERALAKLQPFAPAFLGVAVDPLLKFLRAGQEEARKLGKVRLDEFDAGLIPIIVLNPTPGDFRDGDCSTVSEE